MSLFSLFAGRRPAPASHKPAARTLSLEALEDRTVPSGIDLLGPLAPPCAAAGTDPAAGLAASSATSRPMKGQGSGGFTDANGGFVAAGTASHLGAFTHYGA